MRNRLKGFIQGFLAATLILVLALPVFAAYQKQATLHYNDIKITLDGEVRAPTDVAGNVVDPFIIDGTTYLPVRAVASMLGLHVDWDGVTKTVQLSTKSPAEATQDETLLFDTGGIRIYYLGIEVASSYMGGYEVKLRIENKSSHDITVQVRDSSVNDIMTDNIFSSDVAAGKTALGGILFYESALENSGIVAIENVEFKFHIFDPDTWDTLYDSPAITVVN